MSVHLGIDVSKGKWLVVALEEKKAWWRLCHTLEECLQSWPEATTVLVDIPLGLPESIMDQRPESQARKQLKGKGSSVFPVPCRQAVYTKEKEQAKQVNRQILGKSISEQTWNIMGKIRHADEFLQEHPTWKNRILESHPELCFAKFRGGVPVLEKKTTEEGRRIRVELLEKVLPGMKAFLEETLETMEKGRRDDLLDAACLAVAGKIMGNSGVGRIPEGPQDDSQGILMQMVYPKSKIEKNRSKK
ncbi:DUF429 domain-containing protein [Alkalibacter rhizosphaerae]|uniref:DUF429 domain-containing protein n=1 Tax=Alkalibacter rhizosphaerae TaxID=2815577 RepID=A0A975AGY7_9FIRM|nr:DUF429 domain-containing protein [Alkalibacter rhizosphaerae]QSX07882.1 DUF429 domain-containing protein [Alkalibacter rhizosphaerae]